MKNNRGQELKEGLSVIATVTKNGYWKDSHIKPLSEVLDGIDTGTELNMETIMQCSICGRVIALRFPIHQCAVPCEMEGAERYLVWAEPLGEAEMEEFREFAYLDEAVKYAREMPDKYSTSCIVILADNCDDEGDEDDEDTSFSMKLSEINDNSTLNLQRGLK